MRLRSIWALAGWLLLGACAPRNQADLAAVPDKDQRSTQDIVSVIRRQTPGLRHTFEKYLKLQPGFNGKLTLRFTIAPGGSVVKLTIVSSTTGNADFDQEVREKVKTWRFEPIQG